MRAKNITSIVTTIAVARGEITIQNRWQHRSGQIFSDTTVLEKSPVGFQMTKFTIGENDWVTPKDPPALSHQELRCSGVTNEMLRVAITRE